MARSGFSLWFVGVAIAISLGVGFLSAQRAKPAKQLGTVVEVPDTQQWVINLRSVSNESTHVQIIDTTGVCLYIYQSHESSPTATIAAIAKTQLPTGAGCQ